MIYTDQSGHFPILLITALMGGTINTGVHFVADLLDDGHINSGFRSYAGAFAEGAITGAAFGLLGPGATLLTNAYVGLTSGIVGNMTNQLISNGNVDLEQSVISGLSMAAGGAAFGVGDQLLKVNSF